MIGMNFDFYSAEFSRKALEVGYSNENLIKCLNYARPLIENGLPVIYNTSHFCALVGYRKSYVTKAVYNTRYYYRYFKIRKSNGKLRSLAEPLPSLKDIQSWILVNILENVPVSKPAKAYIKNSSLKQNLVFHKEQAVVLKLDVKDFFFSIKRSWVEYFLRSVGYSHYVSNLIGKLCTLEDSLPQGAPTSPYLSNLYMRKFDNRVWGHCRALKVRYTRYSDDLTFSGDFQPAEIIEFVNMELSELSLVLNDNKTKIMRRGSRQTVTGIIVNDKIQVDRKRRKAVRQQIYYIEKLGLQEHLKNIGNTKGNYLGHLLGMVNYVLFINPDDQEFVRYKGYLGKLISDQL
jgi:RNA-directed DNA polymerase